MAETLNTADDVVTALRERMASIGVSYGTVEHLANWGENSLAKYVSAARSRKFTIDSLLRVAKVLGLRLALVVDEQLVAQMQPLYEKRDGSKMHSRRLPSLGKTQIRRMMKPIAAELGRKGGHARMAGLTPEQRRELGRRGSQARWQRTASMTVTPIGDPAGSLRVWQVETPIGAPE
jgi:hypothetical protein